MSDENDKKPRLTRLPDPPPAEPMDGDEGTVSIDDAPGGLVPIEPGAEANALLNNPDVAVTDIQKALGNLVRRRALIVSEIERINRDIETLQDLARAKGYNVAGTVEAAEGAAEFLHTQRSVQGEAEEDGTFIIGPRFGEPTPAIFSGGL